MNIKSVLFPTDLSACSLFALDYAAELAASWGAKMHILYVDDLRDLVALAAYAAPSFTAACARTELMEQIKTIKPALGNIACDYHYMEGIPADEICAFADSNQIDLIVMSSHGRTGLSRVFLGSVAELVLRKAKCPVLIVKYPLETQSSHTTDVPNSQVVSDPATIARLSTRATPHTCVPYCTQ